MSFGATLSMEFSRNWPMRIFGVLATAFLTYLLIAGQGTLLTTVILTATIGVVLFYRRVTAISLSLGFVVLLGDIRRVRDLIFPHPTLDMLILVTPIVAIVLAFPLLVRVRLKDKLSTAMFWLLLLMILEIFNPLQGGLSIGFSGALFTIIPVLWFWVGRQYGSPQVLRAFLYKVFMPLTALAGLLGLYQNFIGFLPWEQAWIDANKATFTILNLGGSNSRSFGFSVSPAEYATLLSMGAAAAAAMWFTRRRVWSLAFVPLVIAMFLAGSRGVVVKLICTIALLFALRKGGGRVGAGTLIRLVILSLAGLLATSVLASRYSSGASNAAQTTAQAAISRQAEGLANPFDSRRSSANGHVQLIGEGILEGFNHPLGFGIGAAGGAGVKFGATNLFTEVDFSDMFVALGFVGGTLYLYCIFLTCVYCFRYVQKVPFDVSLPALAIIISGIGVWLVGGQYSTCAIWLFMIGCVTHEERKPAPATANDTDPAEETPRLGGMQAPLDGYRV
jgi:hypothetical protein